MDVTVIHGDQRITREFAQVPEVGESVRIKIPGLDVRELTVRKRRWIFAVGDKSEVELECS